jgi:hypothetical protein
LVLINCSSKEIKSTTRTLSVKDNQLTNYSIDRDKIKEEIKQELREELKQETQREYQQEKRYYHSSESGSVIISQNGKKNFKWKKKCNYCGNTDGNTYNESRLSGSLTTMYYCNKCKKQSKVKVTTTSG